MNKINYQTSLIIENLNNYYEIVILTLLLTPILIIFFNKLCLKFNILDIPNKRKSHKFPMPISGGITLLTILLINFLYFKIVNNNSFDFFTDVFYFSFCFFIFGFLDDIKSFNANIKCFIIILLIFIILFYSKNLIIYDLKFYYMFDKKIILDIFAIPFTIFCIFMLFNALNFADGKNGISIGLSIFWLIFLLFKINSDVFIIIEILFILLIILIFNLKNKLFLGNSGVNFLSIFISLLIIKSYNSQYNIFFCDELFLLLFIPGIDAARVTIYRALNSKSPFTPDRTHLHHYLEKSINEKFIWAIYLLLSIFPILVLTFTKSFYISILLSSILYGLSFTKFFTKIFKSIR